jgi:cobalt-precorrin-5B (C1)-methyltransferase
MIVVTSNFIGFMLEKAVFYGFKNILLAGHIGKLIKIAGGIFHTHSKIADGRNEILASNYGYFTQDINGLKKIMESNTTEEALDYIENKDFFKYLTDKIKLKCENYIYNEINIEVVLLSGEKGVLAKTEKADELLKKIKGE